MTNQRRSVFLEDQFGGVFEAMYEMQNDIAHGRHPEVNMFGSAALSVAGGEQPDSSALPPDAGAMRGAQPISYSDKEVK